MRSRERIIVDAKKFAAAQDDLAARSDEDIEHWHHIALRDLIIEMSDMLAGDKQ